MEQDYMKNDFRDTGIEVYIPDENDRNLVAQRIFEELELGIVLFRAWTALKYT